MRKRTRAPSARPSAWRPNPRDTKTHPQRKSNFMRRIICLLFALALIQPIDLAAQAKIHTPLKPGTHGKKKLLRKAPKEIVFTNFTILFRAKDWTAQGNAGVAGYVDGLTDELVLAIADDAKAYAIQKFNEKGIAVSFFNEEELAQNKMFKKDLKKGKAEILDGQTFKLTQEKVSKGNDYLGAVANGVPIVFWGPDKVMTWGTRNWPLLKEQMDLSFDPTFYFFKMEKDGDSSSDEVSWSPQLAVSNGALGNGAYHRYFDKKFKQAGATLLPHILVYEGNDWLGAATEKDESYGKAVHYRVDPVKFKQAADAMMRLYIDGVVDGITTVIAGA